MIVANKAAGDVEKQLDMHALGELRALVYWRTIWAIKSVVVGKARCKRRACAVEAGK